ncbi:MAG: nicotinate-nucleotide--dimethylbenzimidazole phosphoribosyltransferase [Deltaproteobacteria bacterium]|nr:nicotinate-nucleotide--dimethylbenzimidazole phosphoribosyltransferase [Deltaproteobacteria bacterium]
MKRFTEKIRPTAHEGLEKRIIEHLDNLTKPPGSLGRLEEFALRYCLCKGNAVAMLEKIELFTFAGDHGITEENITPFPSEVTSQMVVNMAAGGAAVSVLCRNAGIGYAVVDMGVKSELNDMPNLIKRKVAYGTNNFAHQPAMTEEKTMEALERGFHLAEQSHAHILGIGEMGIGNTSSASAIYSLVLGLDAKTTVGAGTGSNGDFLERKIAAVQKGIDLHRDATGDDPLKILSRVGGYEIAGMTGIILGAASNRIPVAIDGFIASAAALIAMRLEKNTRDYLFFSHASAEKFHRNFLAKEGIRPILSLDMWLGEGTGAVLALQIIKQAMVCYSQMATFTSAGVSNKE